MDTWTHQLGYPLVTLRRHGNMIHASQKHFLLVNSSLHGVNSSHKWHVPLSFTTSAAPNIESQIWMRDPLSLRASDSKDQQYLHPFFRQEDFISIDLFI